MTDLAVNEWRIEALEKGQQEIIVKLDSLIGQRQKRWDDHMEWRIEVEVSLRGMQVRQHHMERIIFGVAAISGMAMVGLIVEAGAFALSRWG